MARIGIYYATVGGNTEIVCQKLKQELEEKKHKITLIKVHAQPDFQPEMFDFIIFASATYDHGVLEWHMDSFLRSNSEISLHDKKCAVIGLGDDIYDKDYHIEAVPILEAFLKEHGGKIIIASLQINKQPITQLETKVKQWAHTLIRKI